MRRAVVWDTVTGRRLRTLRRRSASLSRRPATRLHWGREDGSVALASLDTGKTHEFSGHHAGAVNGVAFTRTGSRCGQREPMGTCCLGRRLGHDPRDALRPCRECPDTCGHAGWQNGESPSPTTRRSSCGDLTGKRRLSRSVLRVRARHSSIYRLTARRLAIATERGGVRLLDGSSLRARGTIPMAATPIWVAFSPEGSRLAVTLLAPKEPTPGYITEGPWPLRREDAATSRGARRSLRVGAWLRPSGNTIAVAGEDGRVSFLDGHSLAATGKPIVQPKRPPAKGEYWQNDLDWSPTAGGSRSPTDLGRISVWDTTTGTLVVNLPQKPHAVQRHSLPTGRCSLPAEIRGSRRSGTRARGSWSRGPRKGTGRHMSA